MNIPYGTTLTFKNPYLTKNKFIYIGYDSTIGRHLIREEAPMGSITNYSFVHEQLDYLFYIPNVIANYPKEAV